jgi:hypothetical protein
MTVKELSEKLNISVVTLPDAEREIRGVYCCDLLSWVMGRAKADDAWITIMSNSNIVAVASLADTACILLAEGVELDENVKTIAEAKGSTCSHPKNRFTNSR